MEVALAFLPKVRLNNILVFLVLNLRLFRFFFSFILFALVFFFVFIKAFYLVCNQQNCITISGINLGRNCVQLSDTALNDLLSLRLEGEETLNYRLSAPVQKSLI